MSPVNIAWYGKLPSHGDFLCRRASSPFLTAWDDWLQRCIVHAREQLGNSWLQIYLTSPLWRFFLCDGVIGATCFAGVVLPSMDKVGRCFPLTILIELPAGSSLLGFVTHGGEWLAKIEATALGALENQSLQPEMFDAELQASAGLLQPARHFQEITAAEITSGLHLAHCWGADHWRAPLDSSEHLAAALNPALLNAARRTLQPLSLWWTAGSEHVASSCLLTRSLPAPARVTAMLDGAWAAAGWASGDLQRTGL